MNSFHVRHVSVARFFSAAFFLFPVNVLKSVRWMCLPVNPGRRKIAHAEPILSLLCFVVVVSCESKGIPVNSKQLATGVFYHSVHLKEGPWSVHMLELDLPRAWKAGVRLRTVRPGPAGAGLARTSRMATDAVAAINGGFFYDGSPSGLQISKGELVEGPRQQTAFAISSDGKPMVAVFSAQAGLITQSGKLLPILLFNRPPVTNGFTYFNQFVPSTLDSVKSDIGFQLQTLNEQSVINDTVQARVLQVRRKGWPLKLTSDQLLVAGGQNDWHANDVVAGDTVQLFCLLPPAVSGIDEALGGGPRIIRNGYPSVEYQRENLAREFAEQRHPRTAVGYSKDGHFLFLITVDGRQPGYSVGMSLDELAYLMARQLHEFNSSGLNAHQALNLDGGGSTTMVVGNQVVNRPSDQTGEREVANALIVVLSTVAEIEPFNAANSSM